MLTIYYRNTLPSIDLLEMDRKDGPGYHRNYPSAMSTDLTVKTSPTSIYSSGPPPPYSSFPSSANSAHPGAPAPSSGYISPSDSRRAGEEESRDQSQSRPHPTPHQHQTPQKQSLPSIKEALGHDDPYTAPGPTSVPPQQPPSTSHHPHAAPAPAPTSTLVSRPNPEAPLGPPNPFSAGSPSTPYAHHATTAPQQHPNQHDPQRSGRMSINSQDSRNQSLPSLTSGKSPSQSSRTGAPSLNSQASSYEYGAPPQSAGNMSSPSSYYPQQAFSYAVPGAAGSSYPPPASEHRPAYLGPPWKPSGPDAMQVDEGKGMLPRSTAQPHSESVKRHLDSYDVEASLNEVCIV